MSKPTVLRHPAGFEETSQDPPKPLVVIPAYNEGKVIFGVVTSLRAALDEAQIDADLLVINDCSKDDTAAEALRAGATVVSHILNQGLGGALSTGLRYARKIGASIAVTCDGDGQHLPEDVVAGIRRMQSADTTTPTPRHPAASEASSQDPSTSVPDVLIGSRLIDPDGMPSEKQLGNRGLTTLTNLFFRTRVTDSQSGLRLFGPRAIKSIFWKDDGYIFSSELLYRARKLGLTVEEYPIKAIYTDYSVSRGQNNWNAIAIVLGILRIRFLEIIL